MKLIRLFALVGLALSNPAQAQTVTVTAPNTVNPSGQPTAISKTFIVNADGTIATIGGNSGTATSPSSAVTTVQGTAASAATDNGNPVKVAGVYNSTLPTFATGQRGDMQVGLRGSQNVQLMSPDSPNFVFVGSLSADGTAATTQALASRGYCYAFNGTTWDRCRGDTVGSYVVTTPTASATNAVTPVVTAAVNSSLVIKAAPGNLYSVNIVTGATAGYLMLFNALTAPADGAVAPIKCLPVAANVGIETNMRSMPEFFSTGITAVFSSTGCFTKTASATAFISGDAK